MSVRDPRGTPTIPRSHPGFIISCALGALGVLLILVGLIVGADAIFIAGTVAGATSLCAALAWRADLVSDWHRHHPRG